MSNLVVNAHLPIGLLNKQEKKHSEKKLIPQINRQLQNISSGRERKQFSAAQGIIIKINHVISIKLKFNKYNKC